MDKEEIKTKRITLKIKLSERKKAYLRSLVEWERMSKICAPRLGGKFEE